MSDTKHTLSYDPNSIYPRGAYGENKCIKMDGEIVAEVFCQSTTSTADHDARVLAADLVHRYNTHPALLEALAEAEAALKVSVGVIEKYAPEVDWKASTPRKGLEIVQSALATARA